MENGTVELKAILEGREAARSGRGARLRRVAGVTQAELAAALNVSATTVSRWETGRRTPRGRNAAAYLRLLRELGQA